VLRFSSRRTGHLYWRLLSFTPFIMEYRCWNYSCRAAVPKHLNYLAKLQFWTPFVSQ